MRVRSPLQSTLLVDFGSVGEFMKYSLYVRDKSFLSF